MRHRQFSSRYPRVTKILPRKESGTGQGKDTLSSNQVSPLVFSFRALLFLAPHPSLLTFLPVPRPAFTSPSS